MELFKNVPAWERYVRMIAGLGLVVAGVFLAVAAEVLWAVIVIAAGVSLAITALAGWCPICAMAGRKLPKAERVFKVEKLRLHD